jgi:hypothetical protein
VVTIGREVLYIVASECTNMRASNKSEVEAREPILFLVGLQYVYKWYLTCPIHVRILQHVMCNQYSIRFVGFEGSFSNWARYFMCRATGTADCCHLDDVNVLHSHHHVISPEFLLFDHLLSHLVATI